MPLRKPAKALVTRAPSSPPEPGHALAPLPTKRLPDNEPLDKEVVRTALWEARGSIHQAARLARVSTARLGVFLKLNPDMSEERDRAAVLMLDKAETVIDGLLDDEDRKEDTAKWLLTNAGRGRGYGREAPTPMGFSFGGVSSGSGQIAIRWDIEK